MHEWALAEAIVETVCSYLSERRVKKVTSLKVAVGELQSIDEDILRFAIEELFKGRGVKVVDLVLEEEPALFECRSCGKTWRFEDLNIPEDAREAVHFIPEVFHVFARCPHCGSQDLEIVRGRGVYIASLEL
ncbi:hydrogenase nickel incorporation protein HypA [Candidatus Bathyarchaeota archaeon]|nr:hydrogenase nickel incorporation protein HypA [Candidatus Bathyarchaeota archaeon]RJS74343.1 MAG: hydrogenase nickel incorporation protein HypA [Candidatus Bathyarchaeota archaeon]